MMGVMDVMVNDGDVDDDDDNECFLMFLLLSPMYHLYGDGDM